MTNPIITFRGLDKSTGYRWTCWRCPVSSLSEVALSIGVGRKSRRPICRLTVLGRTDWMLETALGRLSMNIFVAPREEEY